MSTRLKGRFSRRELLGAARVALIATILVAVAYAAVVALLDLLVASHLTGQVDRQLTARLETAVSLPHRAFSSSGVQTKGARYGLGIYGEPIALWRLSPEGSVVQSTPGAPALPGGLVPSGPGQRGVTSLNAAIDGTTFRLEWRRTTTGSVAAGESLSELGHVEAVLILSEAIAFPLMLVAFFLVALAIGLRSARPVERARRRQLEFTADASHELRTPLSVIEAEVTLARSRSRGVKEYETALDRVAGESARLKRIVEDLLFLARADTEPLPPGRSLVDLARVAAICAERFSSVAKARGQTLELVGQAAGEPAALVLAPPDWLEKLCGTLVDNACRHVPEGGHIRTEVSTQGNRVTLRVDDDGPGISADERPHVLNRFRRATSPAGGHGLGLAIADSVVRSTGGRWEIGTSDLGGARLEVSWAARAAPSTKVNPQASPDEVTSRPSRPSDLGGGR
ncbi:MAG: sensor histidine kinase [Acidimicrobiales bacterium]